MDIIDRLNAAMDYIEASICGEVDLDEAARQACISSDGLARFFSYMTGMTLNEYIRRRRLTLAARDLRDTQKRIIDIALEYGYDSADAFARAFSRQHGITPAAYRKSGGSLKIYPPASFHIIIKGAKKMDFRIIELQETRVFGVSGQFDGQGYRSREELRNKLWSSDMDDVPGMLCEGSWNQPGSRAYDGVWYGIWRDGRYMIARENPSKTAGLEEQIIPAGTYAAFRTECGGLAWEEFPRLFELIFDSWLPASEYRQSCDMAVEVLHLFTDHDERQKKRWYEVLLPVEHK